MLRWQRWCRQQSFHQRFDTKRSIFRYRLCKERSQHQHQRQRVGGRCSEPQDQEGMGKGGRHWPSHVADEPASDLSREILRSISIAPWNWRLRRLGFAASRILFASLGGVDHELSSSFACIFKSLGAAPLADTLYLYDIGFKLKSPGAWVWCIVSVIWSRRPIIVQIATANGDSLDSLQVFLCPRLPGIVQG
jgi:hypothetical protein